MPSRSYTTQRSQPRQLSHQRQSASIPAQLNSVAATDAYEHVQCLIDKLPPDLTHEQRLRAIDFIKSRGNAFSKSEFDIGRTDILHHRIDTGDAVPHYERLRRHPTSQLQMIDDHVENMLKHDVIEPAASPLRSNVVTVKKRDRTMRFCLDYRRVNDLIVKDKFLLRKIDSCLDMLNGLRYFKLQFETGLLADPDFGARS